MAIEIRTARVLLRGWRNDDRLPYAALNGDERVMEHFPSRLTGEQSDAMVDRMSDMLEERGWGLWAAERLDTRQFIGFVGLSAPTWHVDGLTPCIEVGWRLAQQHWGHGFAPEAASAVLDHVFGHAFEHLPLLGDEVVSFTTTGNVNSQRVMQKIGMHLDPSREFDHPMTPGWVGQRHVVYRIDRPTWAARVAR